MHHIFIAGAGNIGRLIAILLANSQDYQVICGDKYLDDTHLPSHPALQFIQMDITNKGELSDCLKKNHIHSIVSCLPYFHNLYIAQLAAELDLHYFDLTEDVAVTTGIKKLAQHKTTAFVPQCGVAPGFINIVANQLIKKFEKVDAAYLRAGSLPRSTHNALQYAITWSIDGLINEYGNDCYGLVDGKITTLKPLEDVEQVELDGTLYEAFNTSGGVGSLIETYQGKVDILNYKTLRYPGHCEKMRFLMQDLRLNEERDIVKHILEKNLPKTHQDVMLVYVSVKGKHQGSYTEESYVNRYHPKELFQTTWSAIQLTTASSACAVVDIVLQSPQLYQGFVKQEDIPLHIFFENRFGKMFKKTAPEVL